jgi:3-deoxy-manno-octulosonate cytidylyltransferase (CMP-KDO synthetase)
MRTLVVIPARYGSTRFPGKPLQPVLGVPLLQRVYAIARSVAGSDVIISTDDERIARFAQRLGAETVMTSPDIRNGTERVAATLALVPSRPDFVVNLQGDAVLTPPWVVEALIAAAEADPALRMATPATRMTPDSYERLRAAKSSGEVGGTTVTFDRDGRALYFSKSIIPFVRTGAQALPVFRHIGLYGYRPDTLRTLVSLEPGPLERAEQLEQLRALEHGIPIRVVTVDYRGRTHWGIDTEEDLRRCEALIRAEGELLPTYETDPGRTRC